MQHSIHAISGTIMWDPADVGVSVQYDPSIDEDLTYASDRVSRMEDKSGNDHYITQNFAGRRPLTNSATIGGLNAILYSGVLNDEVLGNDAVGGAPLIGQGDLTILAVFDSQRSVAQEEVIFEIQNNTSMRVSLRTDTTGLKAMWSGGPNVLTTGGAPSGQHIGGLFRQGNTLGVNLDGGAAITGTGASDFTDGNQKFIGARRNGFQLNFEGAIGEIVVLPNYSVDLYRKCEGYLAHKWGLTANLPDTHPYKDNAPTSFDPLFHEDFELPVVTGYDESAIPKRWLKSNIGFGAGRIGLNHKSAGDFVAPSPNINQGLDPNYTNSGYCTKEHALGPIDINTVTYELTIKVAYDKSITPPYGNESGAYDIQLCAIEPTADRQDFRSAIDWNDRAIIQLNGSVSDDGLIHAFKGTYTTDPVTDAGLDGYDLGVAIDGATSHAIITHVEVRQK